MEKTIRASRSTQLCEISNKNTASDNEEKEVPTLPCFEENVLRLYRAKNYQRCIKTIERILKVTPKENSAHYKILLAASYTMTGKKFKKSHSILNKVLQVNPSDAFALYGKAVAFYFEREFDRSVEYLDKAIEVDPSPQMNRARDLKIKIDLERNKAMVVMEKLNVQMYKEENLKETNDNEEEPRVLAQLDSTLSQTSETTLSPSKEAFSKGLEYYMNGNLEKSLKYFGKAIKLEPEFEEAEEMGAKAQELVELLDIADINLSQKNYEVVVEIINQALEVVEDTNERICKILYFKRGLAYFHLEENELSLKDYAEFERLKQKFGED